MSQGTHHYANIALHWREWFRNKQYDIAYQDDVIQSFVKQVEELTKGEENKRLNEVGEEMVEERWENFRKCLAIQQSECPIGFFRPSWEQAQVLNCWSPEYEPLICGEGYQSICNFTTNRGGKTTGSVIDTDLWVLICDPEWEMFQWQEDVEGRKHGNDRGRYRVEMRPDWEYWRRSGKLRPPGSGCAAKGDPIDVWHGIENDNAWHDKVGKEYMKWLPKNAIGRRADGGTAIFKQERRIELSTGHKIIGKTFNSDVQDWAGGAAWRINMDEGFDRRIFNEVTLRIQSGGYFHWAYTAAEARNIGERARLAYECYKGKHNLVGRTKFFTGFRMDMIPEWIMPEDKKQDDLARLRREGEMGRVRMGEIPFMASSPTVFSNFDRDINILPIDGPEVLAAIRGETLARWVEAFGKSRADLLQWAFHKANIIRGMDEGLANPTACVWDAILKTGEHVAFKEWEESGLSVSERCEAMIDRSGNRRVCVNPEEIKERRRWVEEVVPLTGMTIRKTFADSKMFKRDALAPSDDWTLQYSRQGLRIVRATSIGPAQRCDKANDMLRGEATRKHLIYSDKAGPRAYVTRDCLKLIERFENYLWQQISTGQRTGDFTDKPETRDDHTLDAGPGYCWNSDLKWLDPDQQPQTSAVRYDSLTGAVIR